MQIHMQMRLVISDSRLRLPVRHAEMERRQPAVEPRRLRRNQEDQSPVHGRLEAGPGPVQQVRSISTFTFMSHFTPFHIQFTPLFMHIDVQNSKFFIVNRTMQHVITQRINIAFTHTTKCASSICNAQHMT